MDVLNIEWSTWDAGGLGIETYFGDFYFPLRTIVLVGLIVVGLRVRKIMKTRRIGTPVDLTWEEKADTLKW